MYDGAGKTITPKIAEIQQVVARHNGITVADLESANRKREFAIPRQIAAYLCREMTSASFPAIARRFGGRDHTTILFAYRKISAAVDASMELFEALEKYKAEIMQIAAERAERESLTRIDFEPMSEHAFWAFKGRNYRLGMSMGEA